jgi:hypothetical protein
MLTRRQALQAILSAPAFRLLPATVAPLAYTLAPSGNFVISLPSLPPGATLELKLTQGGGGRTVTWPAGMRFEP